MRRFCTVLVALLLVLMSGPAVHALDPLYERNGTAFLLVSDDNHVQNDLDGVYQINRTPTGSPEKLFYPGLTYGIGVNLDLALNTFSEKKDNPWISYTGPQEKVVNFKQADGYFTGQAWWHRCINQVNGSGRIPGSIGHFPCERGLHPAGSWAVLNDAVGGDPGFKRMKIPGGQWYHCTTPAALGWPYPAGWMAANETDAHAYQNPNPFITTSNSWKMYSDVEKRLYHEYYRHTWHPGDGEDTPPQGPKVAESFEVDITRNIRNGCFDGCGIDQSVVPLPADKWHTAMVFNRFSKSYFYCRKIDYTDAYIDIDGVRHPTYPVIGAMFNTTSVNIGVSMKSVSEDYVYVLGKDVADNWLSSYYGYPVSIGYGGSTVSDQWYLKGGTVFFYDHNTGRVYQIERDEGLPEVPGDTYAAKKIAKIIIHSGLGTDLDGIATDGHGNLFYTKSNTVPVSHLEFTFPMRTSVTWGAVSGDIRPGTVKYRQNVYKTVFKKDISGVQSEEGNLLIGHRIYDQNIRYYPYASTSDLTDISKWQKQGDPYLTHSSLGNASRTEMAVVNVATPPEARGERTAKIDINGPYKDGGAGDYKVAEGSNNLSPTLTYKFEVENYPLHNGKINQRVYTDPEVDERFRRIDRHSGEIDVPNDFIGGFVSTLRILGSDNTECVKYTWRIYQTVNAANQPLPSRNLIYERGVDEDYYRPYIFASFDYGEYDIELTAEYQWYDTDALLYGSTVASLSSVLRPNDGTMAQGKAKDGSTIAKMHIIVKGAMPDMESVANIRIRRKSSDGTWLVRDFAENGAFGNYFITDELATEEWLVDDPESTQLVKAIRSIEPPHPGDARMKPDSKRWLEASVQANWSTRIIDPNNLNFGKYYIPPDQTQTIGSGKPQTIAQIDPDFPSPDDNLFTIKTGVDIEDGPDQWKDAFRIPSDPGLYELRCAMKRQILWETIPITYELDALGNLVAVPGDPEPRSKDIVLTGLVKVLVRDRRPPQIELAEASHKYLYAENLGFIYNAVDGKTPNPDEILISVPDNNPMAFLAWERPEEIRKHVFGTHSASANYQAAAINSVSSLQDYDLGFGSAKIDVAPLNFGSVYVIRIDKNDFARRMPQHKAIHRKVPNEIVADLTVADLEMDPLLFGISGIRDTSGNSVATEPFFKLGEILLIDTKRPNLIITVHDEKHDITRFAPDSAAFGNFSGYVFLNDSEIWTGNPTPSNLGNVDVGGTLISPLLARLQETPGQELEVDSPIRFELRGVDNITASTAIGLDFFRLQKLIPAPVGSLEQISMPVHRRIFRMDAGGGRETWAISGQISDKAVSLPSNPVYYQDPYNPLAIYPKTHRIRTFNNLIFDVYNTSLDVRIIDRGQR
ncbi:MAG: hypothetical protein CVV42_11365 [Candidatus Riflebacteria bacterium HGW-Riflebacteria-2]|jgi:hypothetical protein|nr:MAG: hypothetical protein CVV42_11365 [Candidatus Riflebacteria bacterium HGW-Riflebacteria-2]